MLYPIEMTLGERIKAARERLEPEVTQAAIGELFGISDKAVSAWERDDTRPGIEKMPKLARGLKVPLGWLLEGGAPVPAVDDPTVQLETLSAQEQSAVAAFIQHLRQQGRRSA